MMRTRLPQYQPAIVIGVGHVAEALLADDHKPCEPASATDLTQPHYQEGGGEDLIGVLKTVSTLPARSDLAFETAGLAT